tara:strand:+ start:261 stop:470 length:210 start_codon:yes stop_codon:yes gene_type:complete
MMPTTQEIAKMLWDQGACCDCGGPIWTQEDATAHATGEGCLDPEGEPTFTIVHSEFFELRTQRNRVVSR